MSYEYTISRQRDGLEALTVEPIGIEGRNFWLELVTRKASRGGIWSNARVFEHNDGFKTTDVFGDYSKTLATSPARATEKAIRALHEKALDSMRVAMIEAREHTVAKLAKKAADEARHQPAPDSAMQDNNYVGHPMHY